MKRLVIAFVFIMVTGVAFGQTIQKGGMLSLHEWTLKLNSDVTMDQFLEHWKSNFIPVMKELIPEMKPYIVRSLGDQTRFAGLYYWNSMEDLGIYYNPDGSPTETGAAAHEKVMPLMEGLSEFGEFTWTEENWLVLE